MNSRLGVQRMLNTVGLPFPLSTISEAYQYVQTLGVELLACQCHLGCLSLDRTVRTSSRIEMYMAEPGEVIMAVSAPAVRQEVYPWMSRYW